LRQLWPWKDGKRAVKISFCAHETGALHRNTLVGLLYDRIRMLGPDVLIFDEPEVADETTDDISLAYAVGPQRARLSR
jgi:hypothetical protein